MHSYSLDTKPAPNKWWAYQDAVARNKANIDLWGPWHQLQAEVLKTQLMTVYRAKGFYISYGKLGISVKVDRVREITDWQYLHQIEKEWLDKGAIRKFSQQGVIYRFK